VNETPLLFIVVEDIKDAESIAEHLGREKEFKDKDRVPMIRSKGDSDIDTRIVDLLEAAGRAAARSINAQHQ
jgi:hypothetical protein